MKKWPKQNIPNTFQNGPDSFKLIFFLNNRGKPRNKQGRRQE